MNMEHARQEELNREMRQFAETTAAVLQDHKIALERHEENFLGAFRSAESHKLAIEELRQHLHSLAEVINQQSVVMAKLQNLLSNLGGQQGDQIH
jgi:hypothetical protein